MAHELERFSDGSTGFASARKSAWHRLGHVATDCMTAQEVLAHAKLADWQVRAVPVQGLDFQVSGIQPVTAPDRRMTVRTNPVNGKTDYLGIVGRDYTPIQNEELADLLNQLVDDSGAHFETAGSLRGGRQVFVTMKMPETMTLAGIEAEAHDLYLAFTTSHDGTSTARIDVTPVRIVCANTQRAALARSLGNAVFRHSRGSERNIAAARDTLGLSWKALERFQVQAERLIDTACTTARFDQLVKRLWPVEEDAGTRALRNAAERAAELNRLFHDAPTQAAVRGTAWAALQAVIEFVDHVSGKNKNGADRAAAAIFGPGSQIKQRALEALVTA